MSVRILVTDDDHVSCQFFAEALADEGYVVDQAYSGEDTLIRLQDQPYDLLITDVRMPGMNGLEVTRRVRSTYPQLPVVVMTAFGSMETAIEAIRDGAFDYVSKPMNLEAFKQTVTRALAQRQLQEAEETASRRLEEAEPFGTIIGRSSVMIEVYKTVARAAATKSTVLLLGESGTGKELISRAIHEHSPRASRPFVAVDCGALTETLLESELFGHIRGAFTGAIADKKGVFEEASGGTCFLDEIGDISPNMQAKLLRVLQENEVRRVGGQRWLQVDMRVVAATNKDLAELVQQKVFREDLYYRLNVVTLTLPPLRERRDDIPALAQAFLGRASRENNKPLATISDEALELLSAYAWPGNIRELENTMERAVALSQQTVLVSDDLPEAIRNRQSGDVTPKGKNADAFILSDFPTLEEVKKRYIVKVLHDTTGNVSRAAEVLDVDRRSLYRMMERYQIASPRKKS